MLGRDFEDEVWSRSVLELVSNPLGYFGKMNSTLGSVVPLAMFQNIGEDHHSKPLNLDASCFRHRSKCIQLDKSSLWSGGWSQNIVIVSTSNEPHEFYIQRQCCIEVITLSSLSLVIYIQLLKPSVICLAQHRLFIAQKFLFWSRFFSQEKCKFVIISQSYQTPGSSPIQVLTPGELISNI